MASHNRKDSKGRVLYTGEYERADGKYSYSVMKDGKRQSVYAMSLEALREKEEQLALTCILSEHDDKLPAALKTRIGTDAIFFCEMIEMFYKRRGDESGKKREIAKPILDRLCTILFNFSVVPGVVIDGSFSPEEFKKRYDYVSS